MAIEGAGYRAQLAAELKRLRKGTGLSGSAFARRLQELSPERYWGQSVVSKIETGKKLATRGQLRDWVEAAGDDSPEHLEWLEMRLEEARSETTTFKDAYEAGKGGQLQLTYSELEALCVTHLKFQPVILPSQVRTSRYAKEVLSSIDGGPGSRGATEAEIDQFVADQMARKDVLRDPEKKIRVVMLEAGLRYPLASPATMRGQLTAMLDLSDWPSLEFGVIPLGTKLPVMPMTGFAVFDDTLVTIETMTGITELRSPDDITAYTRYFDELADVAVFGDAQQPLIEAAINALPHG